MPIIENKMKHVRVKLGLPFCLSSVLDPMERRILSDALYLFDQSACLCLCPRQHMMPSLLMCLFAFVSVLLFTLSVSASCLCLSSLSIYPPAWLSFCLSAVKQHRPVCLCMGSLTGIDSLWRRAPLSLYVFPTGDPAMSVALCLSVLHA